MTSRFGIKVTLAKPVRQGYVSTALLRLIGAAPKVADPNELVDPSGQALTGEVLVVDDTPSNRKIVVATLRKIGLFPDEATNGQDAVAAVSS